MQEPTLLVNAAFNGNLREVDCLLDAGADPDQPVGDGWTPLHAGIENWQPEAMRVLLARGADPNRLVRGMTPLFHAIETEWDRATNRPAGLLFHLFGRRSRFVSPLPVLSAILMEHGADPYGVTPGGEPLLTWVGRLNYPRALEPLADSAAGPTI